MRDRNMRTMKRLLALAVFFGALTATSLAGTKYIVTNDDNPNGNSATIYSVADNGALSLAATVYTEGYGNGGGYFLSSRVSLLRSKVNNCAYVGDTYGKNKVLPSDIAAIDMTTLTLAGRFPGFPLDSGVYFGIGLAEDPTGTFLFASFTQSGTITTYQQGPGCQLKKLKQIIAFGAEHGIVDGMKVTPNGSFLIVSYADGTIGSFQIDGNTGALTLIHRYFQSDWHALGFPAATAIDITSDSRWVLFGDADGNGFPVVDVARIREDGTLTPTQDYAGFAFGLSSQNIWLSPDEKLLYISNTLSGQITAVPFDKESGTLNVPKACTSTLLNDFGTWNTLGTVVGTSDSDTGSPLYAAEYGSNQTGIAVVKFSLPCRFTEIPSSPAADPASAYLLSIGADPPRKF
jgi:6-phosphogluconolactonase (cycloisomerase 2 family)